MDFLKKLLEAGKIDQETYDSLTGEYETLKSQRDDARREAAQRRVKLKDLQKKEDVFKSILQNVGDKFGIDIDEDDEGIEKLREQISNLDLSKKVDIDKLKELEAKLKRAEKDKGEFLSKYEQEANLRKQFLIENAIQKALGDFEVFDKEVVGNFVSRNVVVDDDGKVKYKDSDGLTIDLKEGLKTFFEQKPNLLKGQGQGGSGTPPNNISAALKQSNNAQDILKAAGLKQ